MFSKVKNEEGISYSNESLHIADDKAFAKLVPADAKPSSNPGEV